MKITRKMVEKLLKPVDLKLKQGYFLDNRYTVHANQPVNYLVHFIPYIPYFNSFSSLKEIVKKLCLTEIFSYLDSNNYVHLFKNPYFGSKSLEEMLIKADLMVNV